MSCYHPNFAFGRKLPDHKMDIRFLSKSDFDFSCERGFHRFKDHVYTEPLKLPCGKCLGCRLDYSRDWMVRCTLEAELYPGRCFFVTLTYDEEHLPCLENIKVDVTTGAVDDIFYSASLIPEHLTKFMKDLRAKYRYDFGFNGIRFFASGEYGSSNARPHFHLILFNIDIPDLKQRDKLSSGFYEYDSEIIKSVWNKGRISVSPFSPACAGYVARYMLKKAKGNDVDVYTLNGLKPEFSRCSRRPGIGSQFYFDHKDRIYKFDNVFVNGQPYKPPKFFDRLLKMSDPELIEFISDSRRSFALSAPPPDTDLSEDEYLRVKELNKSYSVKHLPRSL